MENDLGLLTSKEAAQLLRLSLSALLKLRNDGKIPFVKFGSSVRYRKESLVKFVTDQEVIVTNGE